MYRKCCLRAGSRFAPSFTGSTSAQIVCAPSATEPPRGVAGSFDGSAPGWKDLGFALDGPVRYRYEVTVAGDGFTVLGTGDLDGVGIASHWTLTGRTLEIATQDELE